MRTIRFRGKNVAKGIWLFGDLCHCDSTVVSIIPDMKIEQKSKVMLPVSRISVGQDTGDTDSNYIPIFEGDIIRGYHVGYPQEGKDTLYIVEFVCGKFICRRIGDYEYHDERDCCDLVEVVGVIVGNNIDNQELLKKSYEVCLSDL